MEDILTDDDNYPPINKNKKFYLANQRYLLTYKTHINKKEFKTWCTNSFKKYKKLKIHIAHESGKGDEITPYKHSHMVLDFEKRFQSRDCRIFDYNNIHPHIKKITSKKHLENCYRYLTKEDPDNKHLLDLCSKSFDVVRDVFEAKTKLDAIADSKSATDALARARLYDDHNDFLNSDSWSSSDDLDLYEWQKDIVRMIALKPKQKGLIHWIFDSTGQNGKTTLCNYLVDTDPKHNYTLYGLGASRDVAENIDTGLHKGWTGRCLHINLSRSTQNGFYESLEQLSDGRMTKMKYSGGDIKYRNYYLIVYANWLPNVDMISLSRWRISKLIGSGSNASLIKLDVNDLVKKQPSDK